ncbi:MAG TPA: hypothetical protein ENI97_11650 [Gammaproteobacteria bacterium]|nr:hypothetical protein [Gammaproteobacteria bacterium]
MKKHSLVLGSVLAASLASSAVMAGGLTGNVGIMSDYFFRGIDQDASASGSDGSGATANGGLDYDLGNGISIGTWLADVNDGLEIDLYGAYSGKVNQFDYSVGFTSYNYTGEFDDTYNEINLNVGTGPVNLEYSIGSYDSTPSQDYTFLALTFTQGGAYATYGTFGNDFDGSYIELGYGMDVSGMDLSAALINSDKDLSNQVDSNGNPTSETSLVVSLSKSFDL